MVETYPFLKGANFKLTIENVKSGKSKKKKKSRGVQAKVYRKLLDFGKVKIKTELARKVGVSRAWVTKVLAS